VGDAFGFCCRTLSSLILSAEAPAVGVFCFCCRTLGSLILSTEAPAVGVFCFCCRTLGSLILSAEAPAVGVFCFFISNDANFRLKHAGVPDGSDGSDGTSYCHGAGRYGDTWE